MLKPEVDSLLPHASFDRRTFIKTALGTGFAASVLPVSAQTIHTDSVGLEAGEVAVRAGADLVPAYRAQPHGRRHLPVIVVIHEVFGVHEHIADVCRRFAKLGYLAIAPNLYSREGDPQAYPTLQQLTTQLVSKVPDAQVLSDLDATVAWAGQNGGDLTRLGVIGFCWGGRMAWLYEEHNPHIKAVVSWYGRLIAPPSGTDPLHPTNPLDGVARVDAPVLAFYGGQDPSITPASIEQMKAAIAEGQPAARGSQFIVYPNSPHAFFADYRASYRRADAEDSWRRATAWLRQHGVA